MVGAVSIVGSSMVDSHTCPCLCLEALPSTNMSFKSSSGSSSSDRKQQLVRRRTGHLVLSSSFVDAWDEWRLSTKVISGIVNARLKKKQQRVRSGGLVIVSELAGQYEDSFDDVKTQILNYFTYKAVRTVLNQLYEMNPTQYRWFYNFIVSNKPGDGKRFIRILNKEKQELAERVMITRLHLYGKWIKKCDHAEMYKEISDQNLELMRERLMETVIWPSDDTNTEKIGLIEGNAVFLAFIGDKWRPMWPNILKEQVIQIPTPGRKIANQLNTRILHVVLDHLVIAVEIKDWSNANQ